MKQYDNKPIPYRLLICMDACGMAFEQELIAYTFGILDELSMNLARAENEMCLFWEEVLGTIPEGMPGDYDEIFDYPFTANLLELYLLETDDPDDDRYQHTFYRSYLPADTDTKNLPADTDYVLQVQFACMPHTDYESMLFPRIFKFFETFKETHARNVSLTGVWLVDENNEKVKEYIPDETGNH